MAETLLSVGIDIGTSTTQLVISRLTLENRANPFSVPKVAIAEREVLYRSDIHFTPLLSDTVIDAQAAKSAGVDFCAVLNGTTPGEAFDGYTHVHIAQDLWDVKKWLGV